MMNHHKIPGVAGSFLSAIEYQDRKLNPTTSKDVIFLDTSDSVAATQRIVNFTVQDGIDELSAKSATVLVITIAMSLIQLKHQV